MDSIGITERDGMHSQILYAYYGDDFTGSTDVLQQLASNGVESVLFLRPPGAEQMAQFRHVRAIGIAGDSRSRSPAWMRENLPGIFERLRSFGAPVNHYKVCSTFDSSPEAGSIGCAIDVGLQVFSDTPFVPVVVAAPHLRRYICFGNLFAANQHGEIVRIDRHPMQHHPVTPMREADLRRHLAAQTAQRIGLVNLTQWSAPAVDLPAERIVLFDGVDNAMNGRVGELLWKHAQKHPLFSASSSGLTSALVHTWRAQGIVAPDAPAPEQPEAVSPLLVMSGSCSAATEQQIRWALGHGYHGLAADAEALTENTGRAAKQLREQAAALLGSGTSVVVYTSLGSSTTNSAFGEALGKALGQMLRELVQRHGLQRVLVCGGDTCSHAVQQLDLYALTWIADLAPGAPLCRGHSGNPQMNGLELVLKGGQVGGEDFFARVREGR